VKHSSDNIEYTVSDIFDINYKSLKKDIKYNTAILSHILEHIKDVPSFLKRLNAEKLLICVPSQENWRTKLLIEMGLPYFSDSTHYREYTRKMLINDLSKAGYKVSYIGFNPEGEIVCKAVKSLS